MCLNVVLDPITGTEVSSESIEARKSGSSRCGSGFVSSTVRQRNRRALWMGLLASARVDYWRKGRVDFLERVIQGNLKKISSSMATFRRWAREKGLKPSETQYMRHSRTGTVVLQFSKSGDPVIEKSYRTHFVSPELSEKKEQRLQEKLNQSPKPVVFQNLREAHCSECGAEIEQGSFSYRSRAAPLPSVCASRRSRVSSIGRHCIDAARF